MEHLSTHAQGQFAYIKTVNSHANIRYSHASMRLFACDIEVVCENDLVLHAAAQLRIN